MLNACKIKKSPINIVWQDDDVLVLNKPNNWVTLRIDTFSGLTLQDKIEKDLNIFVANRGGLVHRLDKETSGLILVAKNKESFDNLQAQFKKRSVKKIYLALAKAEVPRKGTIKVPIGRNPGNRLRFKVIPSGKKAETDFEVISYLQKGQKRFSFLKVLLKTGRTHQIRVHLLYLGHPLVGDSIYGNKEDKKKPLFLVAKEIEFDHPKTGERMRFEIEPPKFFKDFIHDKKKTKTKQTER